MIFKSYAPFQLRFFTKMQLFVTIKGVYQILSQVFTWNLVHMLIVWRGHLIIKTDNPKFLFSRVMPLFQLGIFTKKHIFSELSMILIKYFYRLPLETHDRCLVWQPTIIPSRGVITKIHFWRIICPFRHISFSKSCILSHS